MIKLFGSRHTASAPRPVEAGDVLDRISARLPQPIRGEFRLDLAKELDVSVRTVSNCQSTTTGIIAAEREAKRITATLRVASMAFSYILAEELSNVAVRN
jgi:hypothetical protein